MQDRADKASLCRLLQVNSHFCKAVLPILYGRVLTPFCPPRSLVHPGIVTIIQTLLRQRPREQVSELLSAAYDVFPETTTGPKADSEDLPHQSTSVDSNAAGGRDDDDELAPVSSSRSEEKSGTIDYLSYIGTFSFEAAIYSSHDFIIQSWEQYPSRLAQYALPCKKNAPGKEEDGKSHPLFEYVNTINNMFTFAEDKYGSGAHDEELLFPSKVVAGGDKPWGKLRYGALTTTLRRELTRTLCFPVLEQIQVLALPLSDLDRYLEAVGRLQSLASVTFIKDEMLERAWSSARRSSADFAELEECKQKQYRQYRVMITFVQSHGRLFPNRLQSVYLSVDKGIRSCPDDILQELYAALPPLVRPKSVNFLNLERLANNILATDLGSVKSMIISCRSTRGAFATLLENDPTFLSRCRSLKPLRMSSLGSGSFRWAVDEKVAWDWSVKERADQGTKPATTPATATFATTGRLFDQLGRDY